MYENKSVLFLFTNLHSQLHVSTVSRSGLFVEYIILFYFFCVYIFLLAYWFYDYVCYQCIHFRTLSFELFVVALDLAIIVLIIQKRNALDSNKVRC